MARANHGETINYRVAVTSCSCGKALVGRISLKTCHDCKMLTNRRRAAARADRSRQLRAMPAVSRRRQRLS